MSTNHTKKSIWFSNLQVLLLGQPFLSLHVNLLSHKSRHSQDSVCVGSSCFPNHIYTEIVKVHD